MPRPHIVVLAAMFATLAGLAPARADSIFVRVTNQKTGVVVDWYNPTPTLGEVSLAEHGLVEHLSWSVISPRDAASGLPTGKRMHRPVTLGARMSAATLQLGTALTDNDNLTTVQLLFFSADADTGVQTLSRTMTLTNASVASLSVYTIRDDDELLTFMDVSFTYQKVGIEDYAHGISYQDDWETPVSAPQIP